MRAPDALEAGGGHLRARPGDGVGERRDPALPGAQTMTSRGPWRGYEPEARGWGALPPNALQLPTRPDCLDSDETRL